MHTFSYIIPMHVLFSPQLRNYLETVYFNLTKYTSSHVTRLWIKILLFSVAQVVVMFNLHRLYLIKVWGNRR